MKALDGVQLSNSLIVMKVQRIGMACLSIQAAACHGGNSADPRCVSALCFDNSLSRKRRVECMKLPQTGGHSTRHSRQSLRVGQA